jgi:hypothetical protein
VVSWAIAKVVPSAKAHAAKNAGPANRRNAFHRSIDEFITDLSSFLRAPIQPALDLGLPRVLFLGSIPEMRRRRGWAATGNSRYLARRGLALLPPSRKVSAASDLSA